MNFRRKGFSKKKPGNQDVTLQITSMLDIFSVILIFLLKSFLGGEINLSPSKDLKLPVATTERKPKAALTVEISENAVQVENNFVVALEEFRFHSKDLLASGIPSILHKNFEKQRKRQDLIAQVNTDVEKNAKILIVADLRTPHITLKRVLSTAALHGFNEPKLVVLTRD